MTKLTSPRRLSGAGGQIHEKPAIEGATYEVKQRNPKMVDEVNNINLKTYGIHDIKIYNLPSMMNMITAPTTENLFALSMR